MQSAHTEKVYVCCFRNEEMKATFGITMFNSIDYKLLVIKAKVIKVDFKIDQHR